MSEVEDLFARMANEIFDEVRVDKAKNDWAYQQCKEILSSQMAMMSATMGLSIKRVRAFNKVKESLRNDLVSLKQEGKLL